MRLDRLPKRPNILILINDQQRYERDWPAQWAARHLPSMDRLKRHGLSFRNAFIAACACSPSRASILTGTYPSQHGVYHTLAMPGDSSNGNPPAGFSQQPLLPTQPNLARMLQTVGYKVVWKGKWHLSIPVDLSTRWGADDVVYLREAYGFEEWNPNDAGNSIANYATLGGGDLYDNDARFVGGVLARDDRTSPPGESAVGFLRRHDPDDGPFCLVVSVVNPHDIWVAPGFSSSSGYREGMGSQFGLPVPENVHEDLSRKPRAQGLFRAIYNAMTVQDFGASKSLELPVNQRNYVNFYAYLQTLADRHVMSVLDALDQSGLAESTLIVRMADHGEMAMAHGLREKMYNAYEETIHVPLIVSNPLLFPNPEHTDALVSTVDILPTLASIAGAYDDFAYVFRGIDLTPVLEDPGQSVQDAVHFTYDDGYLVGDVPPYIRAIRTDDWMYAVYFNSAGSEFDYELYDLRADARQNENLAGVALHEQQLRSLHVKLEQQMKAAGTSPAGIPLISPALTLEAKRTGEDLIPDVHWPTVDEAAEQSRKQRHQPAAAVSALAGAIGNKGFWIAQTSA